MTPYIKSQESNENFFGAIQDFLLFYTHQNLNELSEQSWNEVLQSVKF